MLFAPTTYLHPDPVLVHAVMQTVAVAVALELWRAADSFHVLDTSVTLCFVSTVEAFAFFTVTVIFGTAAIAAVPSTPSIIAVGKGNRG